MEDSRFDRVLKRLGNLAALALVAIFLLPVSYMGYRLFRGIFFPKQQRTAVTAINKETGERESLNLGRFHRLQGTTLLAAALQVNSGMKDFYYSSYEGPNSKIRNYLFFDLQSKTTNWLRPEHSGLFIKSHELVKDPRALKKGVEFDWAENAERFKDEAAVVTGIVYEAVLSDSNKDHRLSPEDKRSVLFLNFADRKLKALIEQADDILGVEQISEKETLLFFVNEHKNYMLPLDMTTANTGEKVELASVETGN